MCTIVSEESLYMELLAVEHSGEEPDDGELEGTYIVAVEPYSYYFGK